MFTIISGCGMGVVVVVVVIVLIVVVGGGGDKQETQKKVQHVNQNMNKQDPHS